MGSEWARTRARERVARMCAAPSAADVDALRFAVVEELAKTVGFASWGWPLADPTSLLATSGVADKAMWPIVSRLVDYEERARDVNKDRALATGGDPVGVLRSATDGDPEKSARYRDILRPHGFGDELRVACVDRHGCWGHLRLYRDAGERGFTRDDADLLRAVAPHLASALRRHAARPTAARPRAGAAAIEPRVVVLDDRLTVRSFTAAAGSWFDAFAGDAPPRGANARCAVFAVAARCLARAASAIDARARLRLDDGRWVVADAVRLEGPVGGVAVTVHAAAPGEALDVVVRACGLTPRERELVALVVEGRDTKEIAARLGIAPYTVQQHLKSVFAKVGVRSRRELVAGVFGLAAR